MDLQPHERPDLRSARAAGRRLPAIPSLRLGEAEWDLNRRCAVMAIVNRTPDSFYDKGATYELDAAVDHALAQQAAGADLIDVGGVKAGPGAEVTADMELERIIPFVEAFRRRSAAPLSVDTFRGQVAAAALDAGADLINDVSGLADPTLADAVATRPGTALVVMHAPGPTRTRPFRPGYHPDVTTVVVGGLRRLVAFAVARGVDETQIIVDPGHDFGKNTMQSLELTRRLGELAELGRPVLVALSRKDFLGEITGQAVPPSDRLESSLGAAAASLMLGARMVRVHDAEATVRVVRTVESILGWRRPAAAARGLD